MFTKPESEYSKNRTNDKLINYYLQYMLNYLHKLYPDQDISFLRKKLIELVKSKYQPQQIDILEYPEPGNINVVSKDLLELTDNIQDNIITPSGTIYKPVAKEESFFSKYIGPRKKLRKKVKKEMLKYEAIGDKINAKSKHFEQLAIKVGINAISGVMCSNVYFRSIPCYNSITSSARHNIMTGYASIEKLLESNLYLEDENDAINYITIVLDHYPGDEHLSKIIKKYHLKIPSIGDFLNYIVPCIYSGKRTLLVDEESDLEYLIINEFKALNKYIHSLSDLERTFVFYVHSLKNIFMFNTDIFKQYLNKLFDIKLDNIPESYQNQSIFDLEDNDLVIMITTIFNDLLKGKTLDQIEQNDPDIKAIIIYIYRHLEQQLKKIEDLWNTFIMIDINVPKPFSHPKMIRKCVILSDTDSIIFTTAKWIRWYKENIVIDKKALEIHSLIIYLATKFLEHMLAVTSKDVNIDEQNIKKVSMKNEFFYMVLMRTVMSKHYAGYISIKEGTVLPKYKFDFKGKNFKGSDLTEETLEVIEQYVKKLFDEYISQGYIDKQRMIKEIIDQEVKVYNSVKNGETYFLTQIPIKHESEYENPLSSNYYYYLLWEEVFADKYDHITIPQKCFNLSLDTAITNKNYKVVLEKLKKHDKNIYQKFEKFILKYPNKKITRIIIPPNIQIPKELLYLIDYKKIIYSNCFGLYLVAKSFGITPVEYGTNDFKQLLGEIYLGLVYS